MNHNDLQNICVHFNLGTPAAEITPITGGLLHKMYRCKTSNGIFAVKELSEKIDLTNQKIIDNYNLTENIALSFKKSRIPAITAISVEESYLHIIHHKGFLVYPWIEARTLAEDLISEKHALKIAKTLAKIHHINLSIPGFSEPIFELHENSKIIDLANQAKHLKISADQINLLLTLSYRFHEIKDQLKNNYIVSHCDCDQKNVLWDENDNPILIDWESAGLINQTYDIINIALYWSGITTKFNENIFYKMLQIYENSGGNIDRASYIPALYASAWNWINWLIYNIERSFSRDPDQSKTGEEQASKTLHTISNLDKIIQNWYQNSDNEIKINRKMILDL